MKNLRRQATVVTVLTLLVGGLSVLATNGDDEKKKPIAKPAAVKRTRKNVRMLDDLYKTAVVLITEHYVVDENSVPAGGAAKLLFAAMKKKGWHEVEILDASGEPSNDENVASDDFEKAAIQKLLKGETFVDEVITVKGKPYLRAATPIPVAHKKCVLCHDNYAKAKEGQPIGALVYTVPIE